MRKTSTKFFEDYWDAVEIMDSNPRKAGKYSGKSFQFVAMDTLMLSFT